jgi:hypothetical protein
MFRLIEQTHAMGADRLFVMVVLMLAVAGFIVWRRHH